jgi:ABC-type polar amino acid transport system ATPase subunit
MLELKEVTKSFGPNVILNSLNLQIRNGDVLAVIGPSGSGKSTLLRCINFLEKPEKGTITIDGFFLDAKKARRNDIVELRKKTAMVFQQFNLFRQKTALENVMEGLVTVKKFPKNEARDRAMHFLVKVGLEDRMGYYPKHLSGGQQQRVAIARSMTMEPSVLLLDEPTSALDPELVGDVLDTIRMAVSEGYTIVLVSHELEFVRNAANRTIFLEHGNIAEDGTPEQVFNNPRNARIKAFLTRFYTSRSPDFNI